MHLQTDLACEINYCEGEKVVISKEAEMLYYELMRALEEDELVELIDDNLSSNFNFGQYIESKAKTAGKKLGILNKVKRYFKPATAFHRVPSSGSIVHGVLLPFMGYL
ncbi:jg14607 [Pararge aegeria aegeria]|uniref:Jg14607 protein n=1 Tax=Pararge aegeria aegeria TaxID=348720 RepID=A0A8S4R3I6_9NEOP|nr:jg14607 [Pararge aegeria aegeria]